MSVLPLTARVQLRDQALDAARRIAHERRVASGWTWSISDVYECECGQPILYLHDAEGWCDSNDPGVCVDPLCRQLGRWVQDDDTGPELVQSGRQMDPEVHAAILRAHGVPQ